MSIAIPELVQTVPLNFAEYPQVIRVTGSRIPIDTVVRAYLRGETVNEIVDGFPTLSPKTVHLIISYYLENQQFVDTYLAERKARAKVLWAKIEAERPPDNLRQRLLKRKYANGVK